MQLTSRQQNCIYYMNLQLFSHYIFTQVSALAAAARVTFKTLFSASAVTGLVPFYLQSIT